MTMKGSTRLAPAAALLTALALCVSAATASAKPVKLVLSSHIGWEVDKTTGANLCTLNGPDECQPAQPAPDSQSGAFQYPHGVAVAASGDVYVTEVGEHRVKELTPAGEFVLMFGKAVNATTGGDVCTRQEVETGAKCQAGTESASAGGLENASALAIERSTGDVYVYDVQANRVDKYTPAGSFVWAAGKGVDETTGADLCTAASKDLCGPGARTTPESKEACAFDLTAAGLAVGGPGNDMIYVADAHRIQELAPEGSCTGEIEVLPAGSEEAVLRLVAGSETAYITTGKYQNATDAIREYSLTTGAQTGELHVAPRTQGTEVILRGLALDSSGHLAVVAYEQGVGAKEEEPQWGVLYEAADGLPLTEFTVPGSLEPNRLVGTLAFGPSGELYDTHSGAGPFGLGEVDHYDAVPAAELTAGAASCVPGPGLESSVTFTCGLGGVVNPFGVAGTEAWVESGLTCALGDSTVPQPLPTVEAPVAVQANVEARPNQQFCFRLAAVDENVRAPEQLHSAERSFRTPVAPPRVLGEPTASFVTASSAVLGGAVNPENTSTTFEFQYAKACEPGAECPGLGELPGVAQTYSGQSARYGKLGVALQASGLRPATTYRYRLVAVNEKGEQAVNEAGGAQLPEGTFTTAPAPLPEAVTGAVAEVGQTSALISGAVDPAGPPATYSFELGVYEGAQTVYGVVFSGPAPPSTAFEQESLALSGLQPGTTYAYRIAVSSGYITGGSHTAYGAPATFTTQGLPSVLSPPAAPPLLAVPDISFPKAAAPAKAKPKAKHHKRGKHRRGSGKHSKRKSSKTKKGKKR